MAINNFLTQGGFQFSDGSLLNTNATFSVPIGLTGSIIDKKGNIAYDNNYIYYCIADYVPIISYNLSFYRHFDESGFFANAQSGHTFISEDNILGYIIDGATELGSTISVSDNTYINGYNYADNGIYISFNNSVFHYGDTESNATIHISSTSSLPIIWKKAHLSNDMPILSTNYSNEAAIDVPSDGNSATKVQFDTIEFDSHNFFNITQSIYNPKISGYYNISTAVSLNDFSGGLYLCLYKNNSLYKFLTKNASSGIISGSSIVYLDGVSDYIDIRITQTSGTTQSIYWGPYTTWLQSNWIKS